MQRGKKSKEQEREWACREALCILLAWLGVYVSTGEPKQDP